MVGNGGAFLANRRPSSERRSRQPRHATPVGTLRGVGRVEYRRAGRVASAARVRAYEHTRCAARIAGPNAGWFPSSFRHARISFANSRAKSSL